LPLPRLKAEAQRVRLSRASAHQSLRRRIAAAPNRSGAETHSAVQPVVPVAAAAEPRVVIPKKNDPHRIVEGGPGSLVRAVQHPQQ
jgi:hypothetical protein